MPSKPSSPCATASSACLRFSRNHWLVLVMLACQSWPSLHARAAYFVSQATAGSACCRFQQEPLAGLRDVGVPVVALPARQGSIPYIRQAATCFAAGSV